jgi:hypothetical protein
MHLQTLKARRASRLVRRGCGVPENPRALGGTHLAPAGVFSLELRLAAPKRRGDFRGKVVAAVLARRVLAGKDEQSRRVGHHDRPYVGGLGERAPCAIFLDLEPQRVELRYDREQTRRFVLSTPAFSEPLRGLPLTPLQVSTNPVESRSVLSSIGGVLEVLAERRRHAKLDAGGGFLYRRRLMSQKPGSVRRTDQQIAAENLERLKANRPLRPPSAQFVERASTASAQELRAFLLRSGKMAAPRS